MKKKETIVMAHARIHINSIDMNGSLGRVCGGLGFPIKDIKHIVIVRENPRLEIKSLYPQKIIKILNILQNFYKIKSNFKIELIEEIPEHIGLGSETQLKLAVSKAILKFNGIRFNFRQICELFKLGEVSGIGIYSFKKGGFIIDGSYLGGYSFGQGKDKESFAQHSSNLPPLLVSMPFPKEWRVIIFIPKNARSISGEVENNFFLKYTPVPLEEVKDIAYYTLMGIIPAIKNKDYELFINSMKRIANLGIKKAELKLNKQYTKNLLKKIKKIFGFGGLSSLGPTCYTFSNTQTNDPKARKKIKKIFKECKKVIFTEVVNRSLK